MTMVGALDQQAMPGTFRQWHPITVTSLRTGHLTSFELIVLSIGVIATANQWILIYVLNLVGTPDWIAGRSDLVLWLPAILCCGILAWWRQGGFFRSLPIIILTVLMVLGISWTDPVERRTGIIYTAVFVYSLLLGAFLYKRNCIRTVLRVFPIATCVSILFASTQQRMPGRWGWVTAQTGAVMSNPNHIAHQCAIAVLFVLLCWPDRWPSRLLSIAQIALLTVTCLMTGSRTGVTSLVCVVAVSLLMRSRRRAGTALLALFLIAVSLTLPLWIDSVPIDLPIYEKLVARTVYDEESNVNTLGGRLTIWGIALDVFWEHPFLGAGTGAVELALGKYPNSASIQYEDGTWRLYPHNTLVWLAVGLGFPGLLLGLWIYVRAARTAYRLDVQQGQWGRCALATMLFLIGSSCAIQSEPYFIVPGAVLWAMLSARVP